MSEFAVQEIQSRIASITGNPGAHGPVPHLGSTAEFDAFGDTYAQAIVARDRTGGVPSDGATPPGATFPFGSIARLSTSPTSYGQSQPMAGITPARIAAAISGTAGAPGARAVGGYGSMPVPPDLAVYGNGKAPQHALSPLAEQSNHRLHGPAAASWNNVVAAARADGIDLRITDSHRTYDQQVDLARRKGLYSEGGLAARPGTSNHGWGLAVDADVTDRRTYDWLQQNGPRFGWVEAVPREPWHWEFRPNQV